MSTRNKACTQCQKARKKCEIQADYSHCQRCFSLGIPQLCQFEVKPKSKDTLNLYFDVYLNLHIYSYNFFLLPQTIILSRHQTLSSIAYSVG
ncbi:hypothetical protein BCR33DRAFT_76121 [Rhizoclosmatium globosum]|uniref:Zn(2)-C6 fungal-type domain-containing protein n=1 Tax=Rhizoclosmatium globosum TaxID=329046 RepID=A0A1Y2CKX5_9FUNG|nr:hypothetical protein BCR33DRAFT_76121 [Rhizoclosmatium globosum]|eukprot:ORY47661.1 hypothetical protein BCR33DRAFT_76121 [Rhizoclosmatium globosum]